MAIASSMDMKVEWIDRVLGEIVEIREHINLLQEARNSKKKIEQLDREWEETAHLLWEINVEMVYKDYGIYIVSNYRIHIIRKMNELHF